MGVERKENMYSIGQFAEIGNVSVKQLRYLEQKKILKPELRNPENNYRYYSEQQLETLVYIKTLRDLGFELNQIVDIAKTGNIQSLVNALQENLAEVRKEIHYAIEKYENMVTHLIHINNCRAIMKEHRLLNKQNNIEIVNIPDMRLLYIRGYHPANVEQLFVGRMAALKKYASDYGISIEGVLIAIFHTDYHNQFSEAYGDLETAFEIKRGDAADDTKNKHMIRKVEAFKGISAIHIGDYKSMRPLYHRMESWAGENGFKLTGTAVEEYILGPDMVSNPDEYVTRLILPFYDRTS